MPANKTATEMAEIAELLAILETAERDLQAAVQRVAKLVRPTAEAPFMPNYERALDQLRTAARALSGAQRALQRRLQLTRERARTAAERGRAGERK